MEPEYALACLRGESPPPTTERGEQYALAALIYFLLTGSHAIDFFSLEREDFLRQIAVAEPRLFAGFSHSSWLAVERVLSRALRKDPAERFPSLTAFANDLAQARERSAPSRVERKTDAEDAVDAFCREFGDLNRLSLHVLHGVESCSLNFGAAGIAYVLYRLSCLRGDPQLLSAADVWISHARSRCDDRDALFPRSLDLSPDMIGSTSLFHRASGVHCVRALVAHATGDRSCLGRALRDFVDASSRASTILDLTTGRTSTVLGCASLIESLREQDVAEQRRQLESLGERVLMEAWLELDRFAPIGECREHRWLGIAHGWAGWLYAALRWKQATGADLPPAVPARLAELADEAVLVGDGVAWRQANDDNHGEPWPGWCHGSAGYVHLWTLAHRICGDGAFLRLAEGAATHASTTNALENASLCCGYAGRAYALLSWWRHMRNERWLTRASELVDQAASVRATTPRLRGSLYKGDAGVVLLIADLANPETACMPLFEAEAWPGSR